MMQDIRFALRQMGKAPGFAIAAVATLALGIGANTAMFTAIDNVLIRPLPYPQADRLVAMGQGRKAGDMESTSWPNLQDVRHESKTLSDVAGYVTDIAILQGKQGGKTLSGAKLTCNLLTLLGAQPMMGRGFSEKDCAEGAAPVVLLSERLWRQDFGADPRIVGKQVRVGDVPQTVIGVMPARFTFPEEAGAQALKGILLPSRLTPEIRGRGFTLYDAIGRLRPSATLGQAKAELTTIAADIRKQQSQGASGVHFTLKPYRERITGSVGSVFGALAAALGLVLLIACANVANLQLSRCLARQQEFAVRVALGASKTKLLGGLMVESGLLSLAGALVGLQLALGILQLLKLLPEDLIPRANEIQLRWDVMAVLVAFALFATVLSSVIPALFAMRIEPQTALRGAGRGVSQKAGSTRMAGWLVVSEVAIATVLLVGCSLLFHTLYNLEHKALGFRTNSVITFQATPPTSGGYLGGASAGGPRAMGREVYEPLLQKLRAIPGIEQVALASSIPFDDVNFNTSFTLNGQASRTDEERRAQHTAIRVMSGGYLQAMAMPLERGRGISDDDIETRPFGALINEAFAREFLKGKDPLGQRIELGGKDTGMVKPYTVVGVMRDAVQKSIAEPPKPELVLSYRQIPERSLFYPLLVNAATNFVVQAKANNNPAAAIRRVFQRAAPGFAIDNLQTMQKTVDAANFNERLSFYLIGGFAGVAVVMVMVGLYGVLSQLVSQRRQEIGVRLALGATGGSILGMVLRQGSVLIAAGLVVGTLLALGTGRAIRSFLFEVKPTDAWSYAASAALLAAIGLLAALVPARRAAGIEPVEALRAE